MAEPIVVIFKKRDFTIDRMKKIEPSVPSVGGKAPKKRVSKRC